MIQERLEARLHGRKLGLLTEKRGGPADTPLLDLVVEYDRSFAHRFLEE